MVVFSSEARGPSRPTLCSGAMWRSEIIVTGSSVVMADCRPPWSPMMRRFVWVVRQFYRMAIEQDRAHIGRLNYASGYGGSIGQPTASWTIFEVGFFECRNAKLIIWRKCGQCGFFIPQRYGRKFTSALHRVARPTRGADDRIRDVLQLVKVLNKDRAETAPGGNYEWSSDIRMFESNNGAAPCGAFCLLDHGASWRFRSGAGSIGTSATLVAFVKFPPLRVAGCRDSTAHLRF